MLYADNSAMHELAAVIKNSCKRDKSAFVKVEVNRNAWASLHITWIVVGYRNCIVKIAGYSVNDGNDSQFIQRVFDDWMIFQRRIDDGVKGAGMNWVNDETFTGLKE